MFEEKDLMKYQTMISVLIKHNPTIFTAEGIQKLIGEGLIDWELASRAIESMNVANDLRSMESGVETINGFTQDDAVAKNHAAHDSKRDTTPSNAVNDKIKRVNFDMIVALTKHSDAALYQTYMNCKADLSNIIKEMAEKASGDFTSMMAHIETLVSEDEANKKELEAIKKSNIKVDF